MKLLFTFLIFLTVFNIHAQEFFSATAVEVGESDHIAFMQKHKSESKKRAEIWKVPPLAVQVIASVQSGGGILEGFNYGAVLPHPAITKYSKFSDLDDFDLVACSKASRGLEAIAIALDAMRTNSGQELSGVEDFLQLAFGPGGDLEIMASEAEKAYSAYTGESISILRYNPIVHPDTREYSGGAPIVSETEITEEPVQEEVPSLMVERKETATEPVPPVRTEVSEELVEIEEVTVPVDVQIDEDFGFEETEAKPVDQIENNTFTPESATINTEVAEEVMDEQPSMRPVVEAATEATENEPAGRTIRITKTNETPAVVSPKEEEPGINSIETYESTGVIRKEKKKEIDVDEILKEYKTDEPAKEEVVKVKTEQTEDVKEDEVSAEKKKQIEAYKKEEAKRAAEIEAAEQLIIKQREENRKAKEKKKKKKEQGGQ